MNIQHTEDDDHVDTYQDDLDDTGADDGDVTSEDTDDDDTSDDDLKNPDAAKEAADKQEAKWIDEIKAGKKTPEDMPENLGWLKDRVVKKLDDKPAAKPRPKAKPKVDLREQVRTELREERAAEEFKLLIEDLEDADLTAELGAQLKNEYEMILSDFDNPTSAQRVKALLVARRLVGLKSNTETLKERRRSSMALPPSGSKRRNTISKKEKLTEAEKDLAGDLPPGFTPPKKK